MVNRSLGYEAVLELSKCQAYEFGGIKSDWLDVVLACYLKQLEVGQEKSWVANIITKKLHEIKPGHSYFPGLTNLVKYKILTVTHIPVGIGDKTEPWYHMSDIIGVCKALQELKYLL